MATPANRGMGNPSKNPPTARNMAQQQQSSGVRRNPLAQGPTAGRVPAPSAQTAPRGPPRTRPHLPHTLQGAAPPTPTMRTVNHTRQPRRSKITLKSPLLSKTHLPTTPTLLKSPMEFGGNGGGDDDEMFDLSGSSPFDDSMSSAHLAHNTTTTNNNSTNNQQPPTMSFQIPTRQWNTLLNHLQRTGHTITPEQMGHMISEMVESKIDGARGRAVRYEAKIRYLHAFLDFLLRRLDQQTSFKVQNFYATNPNATLKDKSKFLKEALPEYLQSISDNQLEFDANILRLREYQPYFDIHKPTPDFPYSYNEITKKVKLDTPILTHASPQVTRYQLMNSLPRDYAANADVLGPYNPQQQQHEKQDDSQKFAFTLQPLSFDPISKQQGLRVLTLLDEFDKLKAGLIRHATGQFMNIYRTHYLLGATNIKTPQQLSPKNANGAQPPMAKTNVNYNNVVYNPPQLQQEEDEQELLVEDYQDNYDRVCNKTWQDLDQGHLVGMGLAEKIKLHVGQAMTYFFQQCSNHMNHCGNGGAAGKDISLFSNLTTHGNNNNNNNNHTGALLQYQNADEKFFSIFPTEHLCNDVIQPVAASIEEEVVKMEKNLKDLEQQLDKIKKNKIANPSNNHPGGVGNRGAGARVLASQVALNNQNQRPGVVNSAHGAATALTAAGTGAANAANPILQQKHLMEQIEASKKRLNNVKDTLQKLQDVHHDLHSHVNVVPTLIAPQSQSAAQNASLAKYNAMAKFLEIATQNAMVKDRIEKRFVFLNDQHVETTPSLHINIEHYLVDKYDFANQELFNSILTQKIAADSSYQQAASTNPANISRTNLLNTTLQDTESFFTRSTVDATSWMEHELFQNSTAPEDFIQSLLTRLNPQAGLSAGDEMNDDVPVLDLPAFAGATGPNGERFTLTQLLPILQYIQNTRSSQCQQRGLIIAALSTHGDHMINLLRRYILTPRTFNKNLQNAEGHVDTTKHPDEERHQLSLRLNAIQQLLHQNIYNPNHASYNINAYKFKFLEAYCFVYYKLLLIFNSYQDTIITSLQRDIRAKLSITLGTGEKYSKFTLAKYIQTTYREEYSALGGNMAAQNNKNKNDPQAPSAAIVQVPSAANNTASIVMLLRLNDRIDMVYNDYLLPILSLCEHRLRADEQSAESTAKRGPAGRGVGGAGGGAVGGAGGATAANDTYRDAAMQLWFIMRAALFRDCAEKNLVLEQNVPSGNPYGAAPAMGAKDTAGPQPLKEKDNVDVMKYINSLLHHLEHEFTTVLSRVKGKTMRRLLDHSPQPPPDKAKTEQQLVEYYSDITKLSVSIDKLLFADHKQHHNITMNQSLLMQKAMQQQQGHALKITQIPVMFRYQDRFVAPLTPEAMQRALLADPFRQAATSPHGQSQQQQPQQPQQPQQQQQQQTQAQQSQAAQSGKSTILQRGKGKKAVRF